MPPIRISALRSAIGQSGRDHRLQQRRVGGELGDQRTGLGGLEIKGIERQRVVERGFAQIGDDPLAEPGHQIESGERGDRDQRHQSQTGQQHLVQDRGVTCREAAIDQPAQDQAEHQRGPGTDGQGGKCRHDPSAIAAQKGPQPGQRPQIAGFGAGGGVGTVGGTGFAKTAHWYRRACLFARLLASRGPTPYKARFFLRT